ncbi:amidohydrolase [Nocardioides sp. SYSU D00038]|uniref:amidohydrolase n=1 Tax=Nocardioides sp. SYSU D00038 TaxID=2812554 RepID=UPI0019677E02|nr:amidohydrolase [Nocardioides sp. SYSU D00038]
MTGLLLREVRIVPLHGRSGVPTEPVDVLVEDGVVTRIGLRLPVDAGPVGRGPVETVEAGGRWLVPGLWDQHVHLGQWTLARQRLDLGGTTSVAEATAAVRRRLDDQPGRPVVGWGHRPAGWHEQPRTSDLDALTTTVPVVLIAGDGHHAWLNTPALHALELPATDDVVRETAWFAAYPRLGDALGEDGTSAAAYRASLEEAAARGVVGVVDFEFGAGPGAWPERWSQRCDVLRVRYATYENTLDHVLSAGLRTGDPLAQGDPRLTMGPLKIISDGSLNTRTAWCCEPYAGEPATHGLPNLSGEELTALLETATRHGLAVSTHAIGDAAVAQALATYERTGARGSIEHAQLVGRDDVRTMARLGVRASVQPAHLLDDRDLSEAVWPDRGGRSFAFRWMLDDGVDLVLGSDAPVSPLDPWLAMAAAVHRSADDREPWHADQALTPQEALAASVDGHPGVVPGAPADLALLDHDPLVGATTAEQAATLRGTTVALTVVDGRIVHDGR